MIRVTIRQNNSSKTVFVSHHRAKCVDPLKLAIEKHFGVGKVFEMTNSFYLETNKRTVAIGYIGYYLESSPDRLVPVQKCRGEVTVTIEEDVK